MSFHSGTNTDVIRSTQDLKRIHIEYEVTNIDELRASTQNKGEGLQSTVKRPLISGAKKASRLNSVSSLG